MNNCKTTNEAYKKALALIEQFDTIIIHRHTNPDGDAIGSQVGLKNLISENYPNKRVFAVGDHAKRYSFVAGSEMDEVADSTYATALAIVLDTSAKALISDNRYQTAKATLRFDHHLFVEEICQVEVVDTSRESCAGLVADFALQCGWSISKAAATALYTGIVTDSGRFRYDSTNAKTLRVASALLECGVVPEEIFEPLYAEDLDAVLLRAQFTQRIKQYKPGVLYLLTTMQDVAAFGIDSFTASRGMVGVMSNIKGVDRWVSFTETENGYLCELRSGKYNINPIAVKYGGGGHEKASGATVADLDTVYKMLEDIGNLG